MRQTESQISFGSTTSNEFEWQDICHAESSEDAFYHQNVGSFYCTDAQRHILGLNSSGIVPIATEAGNSCRNYPTASWKIERIPTAEDVLTASLSDYSPAYGSAPASSFRHYNQCGDACCGMVDENAFHPGCGQNSNFPFFQGSSACSHPLSLHTINVQESDKASYRESNCQHHSCIECPLFSKFHAFTADGKKKSAMLQKKRQFYGRHSDEACSWSSRFPSENALIICDPSSKSLMGKQQGITGNMERLLDIRSVVTVPKREEQITRDERRARSMNIPLSAEEIIKLPMDEFNERLSRYDVSEAQISLIRDIRRRGKNKVAAQNCRRRKLDQILGLADEVRKRKTERAKLSQERLLLQQELRRCRDKVARLHHYLREVFHSRNDQSLGSFEWFVKNTCTGHYFPSSNLI